MNNYTSKMLTHRIRKDDGHVMTDSIDSTNRNSMVLRKLINSGAMDEEDYSIRIRKYPIEKHLKDGRNSGGKVFKIWTATGKVW
jgi:hypothetical protein